MLSGPGAPHGVAVPVTGLFRWKDTDAGGQPSRVNYLRKHFPISEASTSAVMRTRLVGGAVERIR